MSAGMVQVLVAGNPAADAASAIRVLGREMNAVIATFEAAQDALADIQNRIAAEFKKAGKTMTALEIQRLWIEFTAESVKVGGIAGLILIASKMREFGTTEEIALQELCEEAAR